MPNKSKGKHWVQVTNEEIIEALRRNNGFTSPTARDLGIARQSLQARIKDHPELRKAQLEAREAGVDVAESKLFELVEEKDFQAIRFYLQNNSERYSEKLNINMNANVNTNIDLSVLSMEEIKNLNDLINKSTSNESTD